MHAAVVERAGIDHCAQDRQQWRQRRLAVQRNLVCGDLDRDSGGLQSAAQRRDGAATATDEDGHVVPWHLAFEVGAAQQIGDVRRLRMLGVEREHLEVALAVRRALTARGAVESHELGRQGRQACAAQHPTRCLTQDGAEASGAPKHHRGCRTATDRGERVAEAEDPAGVGTAERVDRLIGIAHHHEGGVRTDQSLEQPHLRRIGVLVFVDVDGGIPPTQVGLHVGNVGEQRGAVDDLGVVGNPLGIEHVEVFTEEATHCSPRPAQIAGRARHRLELIRIEPEGTGPRDDRAHLCREPRSAECRRQGRRPLEPAITHRVDEQLAQSLLLLGAGQQTQRVYELLDRLLLAHERVGEGVERRDRGHDATADPGGDPLAPFLCGLAPEGEADRLDEGRRLAGARAGEDEQRPSSMGDDLTLLLVEVRGRDGERGAAIEHESRRVSHGTTLPCASDSTDHPG